MSYLQGWDSEKDYLEILKSNIEKDKRQGFTQVGAHRADIKITVDGYDAAETLSRGQQKLLVCALKISQGLVFSQLTNRKSIYLIDDLPAELDENHRELLTHWLKKMQSQVFITGVEGDALLSSWKNTEHKMFHVKQGVVTEVDSSITLFA
jgi:DNA replication and repair protein RecF